MTVAGIKTGVKPRRKKRKLKRIVKVRFIQFCAFITIVLISYFPIKRKIETILNPAPIGTVSVDRFRDLNAVHLKHAMQGGISPFITNDDLKESVGALIKDDNLVEIKDNRYYHICTLTHSHPYLTPEAKEFLTDLGKLFQKKLDEHDLPKYYFQISSLLRTQENQRKLSRTNGNATTNSSHAYGTTFDIPYFTVVKRTLFWKKAEVTDGRASKLLSEAIGELRKEGRCVAVTERNEACFHITVVN